ncbi:MAG: glycoside hydrolase family 28 protein [Cyclobacteriaceae bacterium]|nr:glycoside hydrolase family 28 protein [Cyclobacteriaceae bacterium]
MKNRPIFLALVIVFFCTLNACVTKKDSGPTVGSLDEIYEGVAFDMPRIAEPVFNDFSTDITQFGGVGDGITKNTDAFSKAIQAVSAQGGGKVVVPRGIWYTGPFMLKSNVNLVVVEGALITFSRDFNDYPLVETSFEGLDTYRCQSPISGKDLENIAITGKGIIDGSGEIWRPVKKEKLTERQWKVLVQSGGVVSDDGKIWYPSEKSKLGDQRNNFNVPDFQKREEFETVKDFLRPVMVSLINCKNVLLDGPTFQNSPAWNIHPLMCESVIIRNLTVKNPWFGQNGDGLDLESCKNVLVYRNNFDVGDDAICIKSGKDEVGRQRAMATENVIIKNNIVYHGHGGFTVGSEMSGGVRNIHISNCTFIGTDIGLRFKSTRGRGGVVENIYISYIDMINIPAEAISFNLYYEGKSPIPEGADQADEGKIPEQTAYPVSEETPVFRNIYMDRITVSNSETGALFQGLPEMQLQNVTLENSVIEAKYGISMADSEGITFKNVLIKTSVEPSLSIYNCQKLRFEGLNLVNTHSENLVNVKGTKTGSVKFIDSNIQPSTIMVSLEVEANAVTVD